MQDADLFVETGTNVGSTLAYVARSYPQLTCLSCEPDPEAFSRAVHNTRSDPNATVFNETSQRFFHAMPERFPDLMGKDPVFWLDAHGYGFEWPLRTEIRFITSFFDRAAVLIDDFFVPVAKSSDMTAPEIRCALSITSETRYAPVVGTNCTIRPIPNGRLRIILCVAGG